MIFATVKLNHNITRNLPIDLICEIVSYTYRFQKKLKFQPMLQNIEDGTMCVLQTLSVYEILNPENSLHDNYRKLD